MCWLFGRWRALLRILGSIIINQEKLMASVAELTQATADLQSSVNTAISLIQAGGIPPADLDPVLSSLVAMKAQIDAAVAPPAPPPAEAPAA